MVTNKAKMILGDSLLLVLWPLLGLMVVTKLPEIALGLAIVSIIVFRFVLLRKFDIRYPWRKVCVFLLCVTLIFSLGVVVTGLALGFDPDDPEVWPGWFRVLVVVILLCGMASMVVRLFQDREFSETGG